MTTWLSDRIGEVIALLLLWQSRLRQPANDESLELYHCLLLAPFALAVLAVVWLAFVMMLGPT